MNVLYRKSHIAGVREKAIRMDRFAKGDIIAACDKWALEKYGTKFRSDTMAEKINADAREAMR